MKRLVLIILVILGLSSLLWQPAYSQLKSYFVDTDGTLTANSDYRVPSQKAVKTYADTKAAGAVAGAHFLTNQAETALSAEVNLGALTTGLLKITVAGGVATPSTASAGSDYCAATSGSGVLKGNGTGGTAAAVSGTDYNEALILNPSIADHAYSGISFTATAGDNVALGDVCYLKSDGKYYLAKADVATTKMPGVVMATGTISASATGVFLQKGFIRDDSWTGQTVGGAVYVSITGTTTNTWTQTAPSATGNIVQDIGYAYAAKVLFFDPNRTQVEVP